MILSFDATLRTTEILMGFAFCVQSVEHLKSYRDERYLFFPRLLLSLLLILGFQPHWISFALWLLGLALLHRFQGPYNGGADRMSLLMLSCVCMAHWAPSAYWRDVALAYLAAQVTLSYFISGWVKVVNPEWRNGRALCDVFLFSAYPVSESLRGWSAHPRLLWCMSWCVMLFELVFPLALVTQGTLMVALSIAALFHFTNACLFGLNRFFWIWISAYPAILWFQGRLWFLINY